MQLRRTLAAQTAAIALCAVCGSAAALAEPWTPRPHAAGSTAFAPSASGRLATLTFAPGSADVAGCEEAGELGAALSWATAHPDGLLVLDGHADPSATQAHSLRLALQRTKAVRAQLVAAGANPEQIVIATFGADGPRDRSVIVWATPSSARLSPRRALR